MSYQPDTDLLGNLRGLLYDWKYACLTDSALAYINHFDTIEDQVVLCKVHGLEHVLSGVGFYNDWFNSSHRKLKKFINQLQVLWARYYHDAREYEERPKTVALCEDVVFDFVDTNTLHYYHGKVRIDLWRSAVTIGFVTVFDTEEDKFRTLIPEEGHEVSEYAIQTLLDLIPQTQPNTKL